MFDSNAPPPPYTPRPNATSQIARVIFLSMVFVVVYNFVVFVRTLLVLGSLASGESNPLHLNVYVLI